MDSEKIQRFKRLGTGGDFIGWKIQMQNHFEEKGYWQHVSAGAELNLPEEGELTAAMVSAKCKSDLLRSFYPDVSLAVRHLSTPNEMYLQVIKMFAGTENTQKNKLRTQLDQLQFHGNYYFFLSEFQSTVTQLESVNGVLSWKDVAITFLNKLPSSLGLLVHQSKVQVERAQNDDRQVWTDVFTSLMEYLINTNLYNPNRRQFKDKKEKMENKRAMNANYRKKNNGKKDLSEVECYHCHKKGHYKRDCPELKSKNENKNEKRTSLTKNLQTWVCRKLFKSLQKKKIYEDEFFILDSGANTHICGLRKKFLYLKKLENSESFEIETANGKLTPTHIGNVKVILSNGVEVLLTQISH